MKREINANLIITYYRNKIMNEDKSFYLKQEEWLTPENDLSSKALKGYEEINEDKNISFLPVETNRISAIYNLSEQSLQMALDELFPNLRIGNTLIYVTRKNNPRVLSVFPKKNSELVEFIVSLLLNTPLNSSERVKAYNDLIHAGIDKKIKCEILEFISRLLMVDVKTLRRDLKNAKKH